jgi:tRNA pseudouridine13 synthase
LAETDLDKISKTGSTNIIKQEEQGKGDEDNDLSDCTKLPVCSRNSIALSSDTNEESEREVESEQVSGSNWQETQMALKLSLTLPASCYATMAIRELLKTSTSVCTSKNFLL